MQFFNFVFAALAVSLLPLIASAEEHINARRHHQGIARRAEGHIIESRETRNSKWSWYDTQTGNAGSCGRMLRNSEFVVAMNVAQANGGNCFKSITMQWRGKTTRAQVVDTCPGCPYGGLDLSPSLFQFFAPLGTGIIWDGVWWFDGQGPEQPRPTPTTSRWTPPPTPTRTSTRRTSTTPRTTSTTPSPTSTRATSSTPSSTASSSSASASESAISTAGLVDSGARLPEHAANLRDLFQFAVAAGELIVQGAE